jgi:hypothetical protein
MSEERDTYLISFPICDIINEYVAVSEEFMLHFIRKTFCKFAAA